MPTPDRIHRELPVGGHARGKGQSQTSDGPLHHGQDIIIDAEEEDLSDKEVYPGNITVPHIGEQLRD